MLKAARVTFRDGSTQAGIVYPATQVAFERTYERSFLETFATSDGLFVEWVAFLGWFATPGNVPFDDWLQMVAAVELGYAETDEV